MRTEKKYLIEEVARHLKKSDYLLITNYQKVTVADVAALRAKLAPEQAEFHVVKNSSLRVAAKEAEMIVAGTPTYFAPEVASQFANVTPRPPIGTKADVYSLALSLRNALDPALEESIGNGVEIFVAQRAVNAPHLPGSRDLRFLAPHFGRWLTLDPSDRPDAGTFASELDVLLEPEMKKARRRSILSVAMPLAIVAISAK